MRMRVGRLDFGAESVPEVELVIPVDRIDAVPARASSSLLFGLFPPQPQDLRQAVSPRGH